MINIPQNKEPNENYIKNYICGSISSLPYNRSPSTY